jgi:hypothetical protein
MRDLYDMLGLPKEGVKCPNCATLTTCFFDVDDVHVEDSGRWLVVVYCNHCNHEWTLSLYVTAKVETVDELLTHRQELCERLYDAGMALRGGDVKRLRKELNDVDKRLDVPNVKPMTAVPEPGDLIYVPTRGSCDHGWDDVRGGVGVVRKVQISVSGGQPAPFVTTHEQPGRGYNWEFLAQEQEDLKSTYGDRWAMPDPDLS